MHSLKTSTADHLCSMVSGLDFTPKNFKTKFRRRQTNFITQYPGQLFPLNKASAAFLSGFLGQPHRAFGKKCWINDKGKGAGNRISIPFLRSNVAGPRNKNSNRERWKCFNKVRSRETRRRSTAKSAIRCLLSIHSKLQRKSVHFKRAVSAIICHLARNRRSPALAHRSKLYRVQSAFAAKVVQISPHMLPEAPF